MPDQLALVERVAGLLFIDQSAALSRAVAKALVDCYHVVPVHTGGEARRRLRTFRPELIVMDLMLPDIDGLLLMVDLKASTDAPIVVCTARDDPVDRALSRRLGAADFIAKPVDLDGLKLRLSDALAAQGRR